MISVYDKLKLFSKRILEVKQKEYNLKVKTLEEKRQNEIEDRKLTLDKEIESYKKYLLKDIKFEHKQRLANARSEKKRRLLIKKKEMIDTLLVGVKEYASNFVNSKEYKDYLLKVLNEDLYRLKNIDKISIYMNNNDLDLYKEVIKNTIIQKFEEIDIEFILYNSIIGGLIIEYNNQRLDMSIDGVIDENQQYIGRLINNLLEEAGGLNV